MRVSPAGRAVDTSHPDHVIGHGAPASCTSAAVIAAVRAALSGQGRYRILYMDTCDRAQVWTTSHCQDQATPELIVQDMSFTAGNSTSQRFDGGGGGAIYNDGDRMTLTIGGCMFAENHAHEGGGAIFFVSNDRTGTMAIRDSSLDHNPNDAFQTPGLPGIFFLGAGRPRIIRTILR